MFPNPPIIPFTWWSCPTQAFLRETAEGEKTLYHRKGRWPSTTCVSFLASRCSFKQFSTRWRYSTCETVLETAARSKKNDTLWKVNGTTTITCKKNEWKSCTCAHKPHNTHHTDHTLLSLLVSSRLVFLLFSSRLISISSAILLKLIFANISVGKARPCEQDTRMPINITAQKNFITLLFVCLLADVVACSLLVGCCLYVCCMFAVSLDWLVVTAEHGCELSAVSSHSPNTALDNTKKTTSTGESCEHWRWKKSPVTNIDTKRKRCTCLAWLTNRDSKIAKIKLIIFGY